MHHVHFILGFSHVCFLPALIKVVGKISQLTTSATSRKKNGKLIFQKLVTLFLLTMITFWSTLMHLSETKKSLVPENKWLLQNSNLFLNCDRFFAVVGTIYGFFYLVPSSIASAPASAASSMTVRQAAKIFAILLLIQLIGEFASSSFNYWPYIICHLVWHFGVARIAYLFV